MVRLVALRSKVRPQAGLLLLTALAACTSGRTAPAGTAPAPAPAPAGTAGTASARARAMEVPVLDIHERAVAQGTRLHSGAPGPRYWQQWSEYRLQADLNPVSKRLTGQGTIKYFNRSPDTLQSVYVHLLANIFAPGSRHNTNVPWAVEGVELG
ncbi:MAG: hypothetical protein ACREMX_06095, partial [Gemmatimonadales bacterium]